jgi:hypothetical protein
MKRRRRRGVRMEVGVLGRVEKMMFVDESQRKNEVKQQQQQQPRPDLGLHEGSLWQQHHRQRQEEEEPQQQQQLQVNLNHGVPQRTLEQQEKEQPQQGQQLPQTLRGMRGQLQQEKQ